MIRIVQIVQQKLAALDRRTFLQYMGIALGIILLLFLVVLYFYWSSTSYWDKRLNSINDEREEVAHIMQRAQLVERQREQVNAMIAAEPDFKIVGYFNALLNKLRLQTSSDKNVVGEVERDKLYRETQLTAKLTDITTKQLTELLSELENNSRVFIKDLEIIRSRKQAKKIDATLTIATLSMIQESSGGTE